MLNNTWKTTSLYYDDFGQNDDPPKMQTPPPTLSTPNSHLK